MIDNIDITFRDLDEEQSMVLLKSSEHLSALHEIKNWLRTRWKHSDNRKFDIDHLYQEFNSLLCENGIDI